MSASDLASSGTRNWHNWGLPVYANGFVASASWSDAHERAKAYGTALREADLGFSADSLEAIGNAQAGPATDLCMEAGPFKVGDSIMCLGVKLDAIGSTQTTACYRLREVEKLWGRWRYALVSSRSPLGERVRRLHETVVSSFLWGSQVCVPSRRAYDFVEAVEARWLRRMSWARRAAGEDWIPYHRRRRARAPRARELGAVATAWERVCRQGHC